MNAHLARWLRALADRLHPPLRSYAPPRDERGRFQFQTGVDGGIVNRVWIDGAPFVREPKRQPPKRTPKARAK